MKKQRFHLTRKTGREPLGLRPEHLGADTLVHGSLGANRVDTTLRFAGVSQMKPGDALTLAIDPRNLHVFDHDSHMRLP